MTQTHPAFDMASVFRALGNRIRTIRLDRGWKQEDMQGRAEDFRCVTGSSSKRAVPCYREALGLWPESHEIWNTLGKAQQNPELL